MDEQAVCEAMLTTGATQEQIAQQLGTTRKTVERRLSRGPAPCPEARRGKLHHGPSAVTR